MAWTTAIKAIGLLIKRTEPLVKSARKMPPPRTQVPTAKNNPGNIIPHAAAGISKESKAIGTQGINHYNDVLKQIPDGPARVKLLASLDKEVWAKTVLSQREKLDKAVQELLKQGINIRRGVNSRGIAEIAQIKPYGYWTVRLPQGEIKFGFSYPALLNLAEKLTPIQKSRFLSTLEDALRLPLKPGGSSKITDSIKLTSGETRYQKNITVMLGDLKLKGALWKDGVYTIDTIEGIATKQL